MNSQILVNADDTTVAAQNSSAAYPKGSAKHTVIFYWTPGVTGNILTVTIEMRPRTATASGWIQEMSWGSAAGTRTRTLEQYQHTATGTSEVGFYVALEQAFDEVRVTYAEDSSGGAGKGTFTAYCISE